MSRLLACHCRGLCTSISRCRREELPSSTHAGTPWLSFSRSQRAPFCFSLCSRERPKLIIYGLVSHSLIDETADCPQSSVNTSMDIVLRLLQSLLEPRQPDAARTQPSLRYRSPNQTISHMQRTPTSCLNCSSTPSRLASPPLMNLQHLQIWLSLPRRRRLSRSRIPRWRLKTSDPRPQSRPHSLTSLNIRLVPFHPSGRPLGR